MANPYANAAWRRVRLEILERDHYRCQIQGPHCKKKATQVDHIVPVDDGGAWLDPDNLRAACSWCNTWRAQQQKSKYGWKRAKTRIILVIGPVDVDLMAHVREHADPGDLIVDYGTISASIGGDHKQAMKVRNSLLARITRGEVDAERAWITSYNPQAEQIFPHHELVDLRPDRGEVLAAATVREW